MKKTLLSDSWNFSDKYVTRYPENGCGEYVTDIPHDYAIRHKRRPDAPGLGGTGFYEGGSAVYSRYIKFENKQHTILDLDGAYMCAEVRLNIDLLAIHPYGYTPYLVDLTDHIVWGANNKLEIRTNDIGHSARWYSGAGLYRDVYLWTGGSIRIEPWDLYVVTDKADDKNASITVKTWISSDFNSDAVLKITIKDANGNEFKKETEIAVFDDRKSECNIGFEIENPLLWDCENPNLYSLYAEILHNGELTDTFEQTFGIREIRFSTQKGFELNGKTVKMRGGCIHHDHGGLGACAYPAAEERKIRNLKEAGFNAVRIAHNPPSLALLEACDKLGMIVMDEAFDSWRNGKPAADYHLWFESWWARDLSYMIMRDRSHPSVMSYSIGNEIFEAHGHSFGKKWSKLLCEEAKKYDTSRPITSGICQCFLTDDETAPEDYRELYKRGHRDLGNDGNDPYNSWDEWTFDYMKPLDIVGYNYQYKRYGLDSEKYPDRIIWGSETHLKNLYDSWNEVMKYPNVLGDFTWTAYDNLGETGAGRGEWCDPDVDDSQLTPLVLHKYPWRTCWQGDLEITGFRRPRSYFHEAVWFENTEPKIFTVHPENNGKKYKCTDWGWLDVAECWTYDDKYLGEKIKTEVYSTADEVRFILNGKEIGCVKPEKAIARIEIPYEKGEIKTEAIKDGKVIATSSVKTTGTASKIEITPEKECITADGRDLCYFDIAVTDNDGNLITCAENEIICNVTGGTLLALFSGNPCNEDDYTSDKCHIFGGRAVAVVSTKDAGKIEITVESNELEKGFGEAVAK